MFDVISLNNKHKYKVYDIKETDSGSLMFLIYEKYWTENKVWNWVYASNFIPLEEVEHCVDLLS